MMHMKKGAVVVLAPLMALHLAAAAEAGLARKAPPPPKAPGPRLGKPRPAGYRRVVNALRAWNLAAAGRILSEIRQGAPGLPEWLALEGTLAYLQGDYAKSIARLNEALAKSPGDGEWLELRLHVKQSLAAVQGFSIHRTEHFEIRYDAKRDSILLPYMAQTLEAAYRVFGKELGVKLGGRVRVEIYSDPDRFHKGSTIRRSDIEKGVVGLCKFNKMMLISPAVLQRGYRWLDTAAHEFVHYLITTGTKNKTPIWLHEGIAKYFEKKWRGRNRPHLNPIDEVLLVKARKSDSFISFKKMEPSLIYLKTAEEVQLAYAEGASATDFILRRGGKGSLRRVLRAIRDAKPEKKAPSSGQKNTIRNARPSLVELESTGPPPSAGAGLQRLFGLDLEGFEEVWKKDLAAQNLRAHQGAQVRKFRLRATGPVGGSATDLALLKSAVARRRTRLADRLWIRGRTKAAWVEYRRALRDEPNSPQLLNRMARLELRLGRPARALRAAKKAASVDPDFGPSYVHMGVAFERTGDKKAARAAWLEAIHINPFNPIPHERLALIYQEGGLLKLARRESGLARQLRGN